LRTLSLTGPLHSTRETVDGDTPAASATSLIFATCLLRNRFHAANLGVAQSCGEMLPPKLREILTQKVVSISIDSQRRAK
jgi:hypothetical protein